MHCYARDQFPFLIQQGTDLTQHFNHTQWFTRTKTKESTWHGFLTTKNVIKFYLNTLFFIWSFGEQECLVAISTLHSQEAVSGVSDSRWQDFIPEHGINDRALSITGPVKQGVWLSAIVNATFLCSGFKQQYKSSVPAKEDHLHVPARQDLGNSSHFEQVSSDLCHLLLCCNRIQFFIAVGLYHKIRNLQSILQVLLHLQLKCVQTVLSSPYKPLWSVRITSQFWH